MILLPAFISFNVLVSAVPVIITMNYNVEWFSHVLFTIEIKLGTAGPKILVFQIAIYLGWNIGHLLLFLCWLFRFIVAYNDLKRQSPDLSEDQLFTSATGVLRSSGVTLRPVATIQKVCVMPLCSREYYSTYGKIIRKLQISRTVRSYIASLNARKLGAHYGWWLTVLMLHLLWTVGSASQFNCLLLTNCTNQAVAICCNAYHHNSYTDHYSSMAQWLERRSLTGELSLIYAWSMVDMWPLHG